MSIASSNSFSNIGSDSEMIDELIEEDEEEVSAIHQPEDDILLPSTVIDGLEVQPAIHSDSTNFENGGDRFYCPVCNVKYTKLKYLKTHMKNCGQTFHCIICNRDYKQKRTYMLHLRTKHHEEWAKFKSNTTVGRLVDDDDITKEEHLMEETWR